MSLLKQGRDDSYEICKYCFSDGSEKTFRLGDKVNFETDIGVLRQEITNIDYNKNQTAIEIEYDHESISAYPL